MARVCIVTHYMPPHAGGVELVAERLARSYAAAGHSVSWIAATTGAEPGMVRDGDITRIRLAAANWLEDRYGMPYPLVAPAGLPALRRAVAEADVVHLHDCLYLPVLAADLAARRARVPVLLTQHVGMVSFGAAIDPLLYAAYRTVGRSVLRHAARVVFVSDHVRRWFVANIDPALAAEVIPNGIAVDRFVPADDASRRAAREQFGIPADRFVVLHVGRLVAKKNVARSADALRQLDGPWHALVVGDGPERPAVATLGDRVTHLPALPPNDMPAVYAAADAFVLPSVGEGMPLAILEALAAGLAVVLSDDPAFADLTRAGATLVPPSGPSIASALRRLMADPADRAERGRAARTWALANATERASADRYLALIEQLSR